jgi:hypothetical protein
MKRAAHGRLKMTPMPGHPYSYFFGFTNGNAGKLRIGLSTGDLNQVIPEFFFTVRAGKMIVCVFVQIAQIARVPAVAAPEIPGSTFQQQNLRARFPGRHRSAQRRIAAPDNQNIGLYLFSIMHYLSQHFGFWPAVVPRDYGAVNIADFGFK